jgi:hypothetical protein
MKLGGTFLASLLLAIWSANGGVKAIIDALKRRLRRERKTGLLQAERRLAGIHGGRRRRNSDRDRALRRRTIDPVNDRIAILDRPAD